MPQVTLQINVDNQVGMATVYIDMPIPRTVTLNNPPNYAWTYSDANFHWHAYNAKGELPTLDAVRGMGVIDYFCKICAEPIVPATLPGPVDVQVISRPPWAARVTLPNQPAFNRVSVKAQPAGQPINYGIAMVADIAGTGPYQVDLIGEAPIAVMKA